MTTTGDSPLTEFGYEQELRRGLSTVDQVVYRLVFMVPIAPWSIFGTVYNQSRGMAPLGYANSPRSISHFGAIFMGL